MPADLVTLRARRRAALVARRRRRFAFGGLLALAGAVIVAIVVLGGGERVATEAEVAEPGPAASPRPMPLPDLAGRELAGQRLIAGFDGTRPPDGLRRMIRRGQLAGVILFADNVGGRAETKRLISSLQRIPRPEGLDLPLAVMADQEGGLVKRVDGPPNASGEEMGQRGQEFATRQGAATARSLKRFGINVNLAPVLDVARAGSAIEDEDRSFGRRPGRVIGTAVNGFARAQRRGGVAVAAKHFPGFGAAAVNTDFAPQEIGLPKRRLRRNDEPPFQAFADAGGELVMLSLASYPAFGDRPAALTRSIATGELRGRLGFEGVSITDSLDAEAVTSFGDSERVATAAAEAGCDLLLYGNWRTARAVGGELLAGLRAGRLDHDEFERSVQRVLALRAELGG